jgi:ADP-ribose pyrophosphatase YjhB (NUDIX family)
MPGGKPDPGEALAAAAIRETYEETGLAVREPREIARQFDDFPDAGYRYETVFFAVRCDTGEPENREPQKCAGWSWHPLDALPADRFAIDPATIEAIRAFAASTQIAAAAEIADAAETAADAAETADAAEMLRALVAGQTYLSLGTVDERGNAYVSYVPYAFSAGGLAFALSGLAAHARHLAVRGAASLLIVGPPVSDAYARARLTLGVRVRALSAGSKPAEDAWDALQRRHGATTGILRGLTDFTAYASEPESGRLVLGFASAHDLSPSELEAGLRGDDRS